MLTLYYRLFLTVVEPELAWLHIQGVIAAKYAVFFLLLYYMYIIIPCKKVYCIYYISGFEKRSKNIAYHLVV